MMKSRANKSDRVEKPAKAAAPPDPSHDRAKRLKHAAKLLVAGDAGAERDAVDLLRASLAHSDKQDERARWLGVSPRYLRYLLSDEVGLVTRHQGIYGRAKGYSDAALAGERPAGSGWPS